MNKRTASVRNYIKQNRKKVVINSLFAVCFFALAAVLLGHYLEVRRTTYQATRACELLPAEKAGELLGDNLINTESNTPTVVDDLATSRCSYTDENPKSAEMKVAAVAVRSAVREASVERNEQDFEKAKSAHGMVAVKNIGSSAFFNPNAGQLNIYEKDHRRWIILSYGKSETIESSTLEEVKKLADIVIE